MDVGVMADRIRIFLHQVRQRLWIKPLAVCLLSIAAVLGAKLADGTDLAQLAPGISADSIETLLSNMAASMLVIATFSVASMVSAYASAASTATPRSFALVVADNSSQNALSTFVGAFIYSIVALTALNNDYFGPASLVILFALTVVVFGAVIVTFVRWVDRIARLGRMGSTIQKVEQATAEALERRRKAPTLGGAPAPSPPEGRAVYSAAVGYVQHIDIAGVQAWAEREQVRVTIASLPGAFAAPGRPLAFVRASTDDDPALDCTGVAESFAVGEDRSFDDDPRFGLVVLSEIAGRALSPGVNDPGTAIKILGTLVRLFVGWGTSGPSEEEDLPRYDRVEVPELSVRDMFDDAFTAIGRDGAATVEVAVRLQKALQALSSTPDAQMRDAARYHSDLALKRAQAAMDVSEDVEAVRGSAATA